jgi:serine/threonine protein kinase
MSQIINDMDRVFGAYLVEAGLARTPHIEEAQRLQERAAAGGENLCLADALIHMGVITAVQREDAEKKIQRKAGDVEQLGNYKLLKKLGEGAMGCVFLAEDALMRRRVALKVLQPRAADDERYIARFKREVRALAALNHPNIIMAYATGEELGRHFFAMEYCEGSPLDGLLQRRGFLPVTEALEITAQIARGLKHAHEHGLLHRDIKPANVFVTTDGVVKILDLGLSKNVSAADSSFHTQTGVILGTPHYIAPEQLRSGAPIDGRADIYSLGSTLYHLVTGNTPFHGTGMDIVVKKQMNEKPPDPSSIRPDIPLNVSLFIRRMMAREPVERYTDCAAVLADLERLQSGQTPSCVLLPDAPTEIMPSRQRAPVEQPSKRKWFLYAAAAVCVLGAGAIVFSGNGARDERAAQAPDISQASAAKTDTAKSIATNASAGTTTAGTSKADPPADPEMTPAIATGPVFLSELPERDVKTINAASPFYRRWAFNKGRFGVSGGDGIQIRVSGAPSLHGLAMNVPADRSNAHVGYELNQKFKRFEAAVAINDAAVGGPNRDGSATPLLFRVFGDGKELWKSEPLQRRRESQRCEIDITGVSKLELDVECPGDFMYAQAVWVEPRVIP